MLGHDIFTLVLYAFGEGDGWIYGHALCTICVYYMIPS